MRRAAAAFAVLLAAVPASAAETPADDPAAPPFPIWPIPQEARYTGERLLLGDAVIVLPKGDERASVSPSSSGWPRRCATRGKAGRRSGSAERSRS